MDGGIADWVARRAERRPDAEALVDVATGDRHTYAQLDRRVGARAAALGIEAGGRVALLGENSAAYLGWLFGAARLGAIAVPINHRLAPGEVAHVLADSGATVLVRSTAFATLAEDALAELGGDAVGALVELAEEPGDQAVEAHPVAGDDPCVIMYTSDTTGVPKGAVLTHDNMLWNAINMVAARPGIGGTDVTIAAAPLFHIGALGLSALPLLYAGGTVVVGQAEAVAR
ncbi:MAG: O-succinylbenzoate-CoA ligase [Actinomycetospora sp.]|nr:O-succinylbenzoate-CoA ligase [Actinomycetospora sp.]